jgi:hypothetical protein
MSNAVVFISFKLLKGASVPDFLLAAEKLNNEYMSKQKGYISWKQLNKDDTWVDLLTFETIEDAKKIEKNEPPKALAKKFYSFINLPSCKVHFYTVEKSYS